MSRRILRYGPQSEQFAELWRPAQPTGAATVVLVHGGYWRHRYGLEYMQPLAADLSERGYTVWNLEYRRTGGPGGGWPGTFLDIADGLDALSDPDTGTDPARTAIVGHSAGGHLALWACGRRRTAVAPPPRLTPSFAVSLAGVCDLFEAARRHLSNDAVGELLGGAPDQVPDRYAQSCPTRLLPLGVPQLIVHGTEDTDVPLALAPRYAEAAATAGDRCELLALPGADHFALIDPDTAAWATIAERLDRWRRTPEPATTPPR